MGQRFAKHLMYSGVKRYHQRSHLSAINKWQTALRRLRDDEDRFITLGYLAQAFCDLCDYGQMLHYALLQMELANSRQDDYMKSEAYLNLSKAYEKLADFPKSINYGKASLQHPSIDPRTPGYAYLSIATSYINSSQFQLALSSFEQAMNIANQTGDKLLELQVCIGLGSLFTILRDLSKALLFLQNSLQILQSITVDHLHAKYKCVILYYLSIVMKLKGKLINAREACEEGLRLASETNNRAIYGRCLCSIADIFRELGESETMETITKSWARYESAYRLMNKINDKMGEVIVLSSIAKSASESRSHYAGQCECQAIQLNKKCLEIAKSIGCKHAMMKCHMRLQELYQQLSDEDSEENCKHCITSLSQEMELFCNFCGQRFGIKNESLRALRCSHIFHENCLHIYLSQQSEQTCPKCQCKAILNDNISTQTSSITSSSPIDRNKNTLNFSRYMKQKRSSSSLDETSINMRIKNIKLPLQGYQEDILNELPPVPDELLFKNNCKQHTPTTLIPIQGISLATIDESNKYSKSNKPIVLPLTRRVNRSLHVDGSLEHYETSNNLSKINPSVNINEKKPKIIHKQSPTEL
ncbi:43 kDa receptor-associated protein of the synapse [Strongyloides ratti]|uniref:43 kDa receptor-associated protein of the synapse n=1 Tax=Strongyloides ratti TaxID=34506 RepID=A0A090KPK0_STRRB|nr:43 kDa receptor-associated protein of the synapse [Strongyloides ratti]CEF59289.1 43 kDa receptor-associated protein of the synapse [Strongyloides ratti]